MYPRLCDLENKRGKRREEEKLAKNVEVAEKNEYGDIGGLWHTQLCSFALPISDSSPLLIDTSLRRALAKLISLDLIHVYV